MPLDTRSDPRRHMAHLGFPLRLRMICIGQDAAQQRRLVWVLQRPYIHLHV